MLLSPPKKQSLFVLDALVFLFLSFCGFAQLSLCPQTFWGYPVAKALTNTFAVKCKWLIKDISLLKSNLLWCRALKFPKVGFQVSKPGGIQEPFHEEPLEVCS